MACSNVYPDVSTLPADAEVIELTLLLPRWQAESLSLLAQQRHLTVGQLLRKLLYEVLREEMVLSHPLCSDGVASTGDVCPARP